MNIEDTLKARGKTHGDWNEQAKVAGSIKTAFRYAPNSGNIPDELYEALDMIAVKLARIACGDCHEKDHWRDIQGYAKLAEDSCDD